MTAPTDDVARTLYRALTNMSRQLMESQSRANGLERLLQEREAALDVLQAQLHELQTQRPDPSPQNESALAAQLDELRAQLAEAEGAAVARETQLREAQAELHDAQ